VRVPVSVPRFQGESGPSEALKYINRSLEVKPRLFSGLLGRGIALEAAGSVDEAISAFTAAASVCNDHSRSSILFRIGQLQHMYDA
jgi:hypothetical protein